MVAAMGGNIPGMKPLVFHGDAVGHIASGEIHLFGGVSTFADKFNMRAGRIAPAQNRPQILETQLAAIPEGPSGPRETGKICLRVDFAAGRLPLQLRHGKRIRPKSESRGEIRNKRQVPQSRDFKFLTAYLTQVNGTSAFARIVHCQPKISAFGLEWNS